MTQRQLHIGRGLRLDPDFVGGRTFALLAKKGAGKSYTARVICEEFWTAKIPFVLLDPMGTSWGLRSSADGKDEGIPVAIFGGEHGDAPLERGGGTVMADLVVDEGLSMVLDMSELGSRAAERQFAQDFLERLYRRNRDLVHVLIDESDLFAPQKPQAGDRQLLGITENIVRRGRNRGIGITLITQRPAVLNKDVLTQVDGLVAMQITGLTDRKAINEWVKGHSVPEEAERVMPTLAELDPGECWWWIPQLGILKQVKVRISHTFDSSPTQTRSGRKAEPKSFADVDMGAIEKRMAATIERAKADDPKELRKRIRELEKELDERPSEVQEVEVEKVVERPVLVNGAVEKLEEAFKTANEIRDSFERVAVAIQTPADEIAELLRRFQTAHELRGVGDASKPGPTSSATRTRRDSSPSGVQAKRQVARENPAPTSDGDVQLGKAPRKMVEVLAQRHPMRLTKSQLCTLAGYRPPARSSTTRNAFSALRTAGYIEEAGDEISLSDAGLQATGDIPPTPGPDEVLEHWRRVIGKAPRAFLDALIENPGGLERDRVAELAGYESPDRSSTSRNALSTLRRNGLLVEDSDGLFRASDDLFQ